MTEKPTPTAERAQMLTKAIFFKKQFLNQIADEISNLEKELTACVEAGVCEKSFKADNVSAVYVKRDNWSYSETARDAIAKIRRYDKIDGSASRSSTYYWQIKEIKGEAAKDD